MITHVQPSAGEMGSLLLALLAASTGLQALADNLRIRLSPFRPPVEL